jgi:hypothetical protein
MSLNRSELLRQNPLAPKIIIGNTSKGTNPEIRATYEIRIDAVDYFSKAPTWYLLMIQDVIGKELGKRPDAKR